MADVVEAVGGELGIGFRDECDSLPRAGTHNAEFVIASVRHA
jgi:hypothetical protein